MKERRGSISSLKVSVMVGTPYSLLGSRVSERFSVDQEGSINLKKASSGPVVSPKSPVKSAFRIRSRTWLVSTGHPEDLSPEKFM